MANPKTYTFSADHVCAEYAFDRADIRVDESPQGDGKPVKFYASKPGLGCGKEYDSPESAIRGLVFDHGCTNIRIHGTDSEPAAPDSGQHETSTARKPVRFYRRNDSDVIAVCSIIGVTAAPGILNRFNRLSESGTMDKCATIGDMVRVIAMDVLQDMDSAPRPTRCDYPRPCDIEHAQTLARNMALILFRPETLDHDARRDLENLCAMLCRALNAESR